MAPAASAAISATSTRGNKSEPPPAQFRFATGDALAQANHP